MDTSTSPKAEALPAVAGDTAVAACAAMAASYVAILYAPTVLLRLPPARSIDSYMIRRFLCASVSSAASVLLSASLLHIWKSRDIQTTLGVYGIRKDHMWQAVAYPLLLTSLPYAGSLVLKVFLRASGGEESPSQFSFRKFMHWICKLATNVMAWRNYVVAPFTEELVFRACMIPLLLCGGYKTYNIIFFSPVFFSLAHLNHFMELYCQQSYSFLKALLIVGVQLGYTVIFGWYASFLFVRTGNLISPIVAHIFCNIMGLPVFWSSRTKGAVTLAFAAGLVCFFWLLFAATNPGIYNAKMDGCLCWHGYCYWRPEAETKRK